MTIYERINRERRNAGLKPLKPSRALKLSAGWMARRINRTGRFAHDARIHTNRSWLWVGEVLASGQPNARETVKDWMASPSHRAILLSPRARRVGVARRGTTRVGHFGSP